MKTFFETLKAHIETDPPNLGEGDSVLTMLCEHHNQHDPYDNEQIKEAFRALQVQMNEMRLALEESK